jgi:hypothetical protein
MLEGLNSFGKARIPQRQDDWIYGNLVRLHGGGPLNNEGGAHSFLRVLPLGRVGILLQPSGFFPEGTARCGIFLQRIPI